VIDPDDPSRPVGTVSRRSVLGAFDRELLQRDVLTTRVISLGDAVDSADYVELPDGHRIRDIAAPAWLVGPAFDVGALRARRGVIVVAVRHDEGRNAPPRWIDAIDTSAIAAGDRLLVIATDDELDRFRAGAPPEATG